MPSIASSTIIGRSSITACDLTLCVSTRLSLSTSTADEKLPATRLVDQEMDALRHENVADDGELVLDTERFELPLEDGVAVGLIQKRFSSITTEGEEVETSGLLVPDQTFRHTWNSSRFVLRTNGV